MRIVFGFTIWVTIPKLESNSLVKNGAMMRKGITYLYNRYSLERLLANRK